MKRYFLAAVAVAGSVVAYDRLRRNRAERELWREATDSDVASGP